VSDLEEKKALAQAVLDQYPVVSVHGRKFHAEVDYSPEFHALGYVIDVTDGDHCRIATRPGLPVSQINDKSLREILDDGIRIINETFEQNHPTTKEHDNA